MHEKKTFLFYTQPYFFTKPKGSRCKEQKEHFCGLLLCFCCTHLLWIHLLSYENIKVMKANKNVKLSKSMFWGKFGYIVSLFVWGF